MRILGIDPGGTTGMVECRLTDDHPLEIVTWSENDLFMWADTFERVLTDRRPNIIIAESWVPLQSAPYADPNDACQPLGVCRWLARRAGVEVVMQQPRRRHGVTDKALKDSGYWIRGGAGHARQALKHVLVYVSNSLFHRPTMERLYRK